MDDEPDREVRDPARNRDYGPSVTDEVRGRVAPSIDDAQAIAERLLAALRERGVTIEQVADDLKHPLKQVKRWTTAAKPTIPDPAIMLTICRRYHLSPSYLLLGVGPMFLSELESESGDLRAKLTAHIASALRAKQHDEHQISELLAHDRDVLARVIATYDLRIRLAPAARILGLSSEQLEFAAREIEVRLALNAPEETAEPQSRVRDGERREP